MTAACRRLSATLLACATLCGCQSSPAVAPASVQSGAEARSPEVDANPKLREASLSGPGVFPRGPRTLASITLGFGGEKLLCELTGVGPRFVVCDRSMEVVGKSPSPLDDSLISLGDSGAASLYTTTLTRLSLPSFEESEPVPLATGTPWDGNSVLIPLGERGWAVLLSGGVFRVDGTSWKVAARGEGLAAGQRWRGGTYDAKTATLVGLRGDDVVMTWDADTLRPRGEMKAVGMRIESGNVVALDGVLHLRSDDRRIARLDVATGKTLEPLVLPDNTVGPLAASADGRWAVVSSLSIPDDDASRRIVAAHRMIPVSVLVLNAEGVVAQTRFPFRGRLQAVAIDPGRRCVYLAGDRLVRWEY